MHTRNGEMSHPQCTPIGEPPEPVGKRPEFSGAPPDETSQPERAPVDEPRQAESERLGLMGALADEASQSERAPDDESPRAERERFESRLRSLSRRGFALGGLAVLGGFASWRWLATGSEEDGLPWPLRRVLELNERLAQGAFRAARLSPELPRSAARMPRVNGTIGLESDLDLSAWRLQVVGPGRDPVRRSLTLDDIKALPRFETTTELRCIEGWSEVVHWAGARLADLASVTGLATHSGRPADPVGNPADLLGYAALETPDREYYVGLDVASALHPQTLLCYEMDGRPLTPPHGAPLRLVIPVKYGIKNLKRIGTIRFTDVRPADYWAEQGYDWYAGH
jgi:DMSO/TMAO reductase YedYZ molybdopterin-dependent catalytic subunit